MWKFEFVIKNFILVCFLWVTALWQSFSSQANEWSSYCLAHLFTHQPFDNNVLGLAYIAGSRATDIGGLCSPCKYSLYTGYMYWGIYALISSGQILWLRESIAVFKIFTKIYNTIVCGINLRQGKLVCRCERVNKTCGQNNPMYLSGMTEFYEKDPIYLNDSYLLFLYIFQWPTWMECRCPWTLVLPVPCTPVVLPF